jgi:hypothetical protein
MLKNYLRRALRTLTCNGSISFLNILGLSAGMTAATSNPVKNLRTE